MLQLLYLSNRLCLSLYVPVSRLTKKAVCESDEIFGWMGCCLDHFQMSIFPCNNIRKYANRLKTAANYHSCISPDFAVVTVHLSEGSFVQKVRVSVRARVRVRVRARVRFSVKFRNLRKYSLDK